MSPLSTNGKRFFFFVLFLLTLCLSLCSVSQTSAAAESNLDMDGNGVYTSVEYIDSLISTFNMKLNENFKNIYGYAKRLFELLFLIQLVWAVIQLILQENCTLGTVITTFARHGFVGCFFWWLLFDRSILQTIVASFSAMASQGLNFGELLSKQWTLVSTIWGMTSITDGSLFLGIATCVILCYVVSMAVGLLAVVYLENVVAGTLGFVLMGFGGSEWTRSFALSYIKSLVAIGFKLFLVSVILAVGIQTFDTLVGTVKSVESKMDVVVDKGVKQTVSTTKMVIDNARSTSKGGSVSEICFSVMASAFLFHAFIQMVPSIASTMLAGVTLGAGAGAGMRSFAGSALSTAAGGAVMAGSIAAGGVKNGVQGALSATQRASESYSADNSVLPKSVAKAAAGVAGGITGAILGTTRTALYEIAKDLGSPSYRGQRTQRFFEDVAGKLEPQKEFGKDRAMEAPPKGTATPSTSENLSKNAATNPEQSSTSKTPL